MKSKKLGLYVHIPFCKRKCNYCDFCSFEGKTEELKNQYTDALIREILSYKNKRLKLDTVFFGGGTPSLLSPLQFLKIVDAIKNTFNLSENCEFTLEANPGTVTEEKLIAYKSAGVNRISLGLQSVHDNELKILGRIHNYEEFEKSFKLCRTHGFDNLNVDLMYAIPEQTIESLKLTLDRILSLSPEHISAYSLILEEGTPLYKSQNGINPTDEETEREMYDALTKILSENGYTHYEISNYSKPGFQSRHNLIYWQMDSYIGVGLSAHSYFDGERFYNTSDLSRYLSGSERIFDIARTKEEEITEYVMLSLRTKHGFSNKEYKERYLDDFIELNRKKIEKYEKLGLLICDSERISLTESGFYVSNFIIADLL